MAELIQRDDSLNTGREKLNNAIKAFNETVVEGDSSVEAAQARVDSKGNTYSTLKERLDDKETEFSSQLAQTMQQKADKEELYNGLNDKRSKSLPITLNDLDGETLGLIQNGSGGVPIEVLSIPRPYSVTPEATTFIQRGKNKFDGNFLKNKSLFGSSPIRYGTREGAYSAVIKLEKGKTYTVSKSGDSDYFGIGTFIEEPKENDPVNRSITLVTFSGTEVTFTLEGDEQYVVVTVSSTTESKLPAWLQIEEGEKATEFVGYKQVKIDLDSKSIPPITPEMTTFAEKGRNLFDGNYLHNTYVANPSHNNSLMLMESVGGYSVIFRGKKGKTYTISRGEGSSSYGIGTTVGKPVFGAYVNRALNSNTTSYLSFTVTLEGEEDHILIGISSASENKLPEWLQIEEGEKATNYTQPNSVKINIETPSIDSEGEIVWFGDSISALKLLPDQVGRKINYDIHDVSVAGSVASRHSNSIFENLGWKQLTKAIASKDFTLQNQALVDLQASGSASYPITKDNIDRLKTIDFSNIDKVVAFYGTNDFSSRISVGSIEDDPHTSTSFIACLKYSVETLQTMYPHLQIYLITPIWRGDANDNPTVLREYCNAIVSVGEYYNLPVLDLYKTSGINQFTKSVYLGSDELHQTDKGDNLLSEKCSKFLMSV